MTYKQKLDELRIDFAKKSEEYLLAEKDLILIGGFIDTSFFNKVLEAKNEFDIAANTYHDFVAFIINNKVDPNSIYIS